MEKKILVDNYKDLQALFGRHDAHLRLIEKELKVQISRVSEGIKVLGEEDGVNKAVDLFEYLIGIVQKGSGIKRHDIVYALRLVRYDDEIDFKRLAKGKIEVYAKDNVITPKTKGQLEYVDAIKTNDIVFGTGPAGTGKTYLAMAMAVNALKRGLVRRIILTRPAIEAGETLGFLPGDMLEKVMPYLRPLYDALYDMMEPDRVEELTEQGVIEVAPLAFMRGRTLNDAFIILDEAQNSTPFQMKMFLTRLGFDSKTVVTGDPSQSDLQKDASNGLVEVEHILGKIDGVKFIHLTGDDVVRHELVQRIIEAYEHYQHN